MRVQVELHAAQLASEQKQQEAVALRMVVSKADETMAELRQQLAESHQVCLCTQAFAQDQGAVCSMRKFMGDAL